MTVNEISPAIGDAARVAILLVDHDIAGRTPIGSGAASKVVLRGVAEFISQSERNDSTTKSHVLRHYLERLLNLYVLHESRQAGQPSALEPKLHIETKRNRCVHWYCGDVPSPPAPHCDAEPFDHVLVWREREPAWTIAWWNDDDYCAGQEREGIRPRRHLMIGQTGSDEERRNYLVLVQSATRGEQRRFRNWITHREPAVLKMPHTYCREFAKKADAAEQARRELLLCVVPLDMEGSGWVEDFKAMNLRCRPSTVADMDDEALGMEAEDDRPWLSLARYAEIFLGDGARKHLLDAHLRGRRGTSKREQADPGKA